MGPAPRVAVVGAGAWGTTLARLVARTEPVTLLCHSPETAARIAATGRNEARLPGVDLPDGLRATADRAAIGEARDLVIVAVPSAHVRSTMTTLAGVLPPSADVLSVVEGLERRTLLRMSEVIADAGGTAAERVAALSGPNLAAEVARNLPASAVVAARDIALAERIVKRVGRRRFGSTSTPTCWAWSLPGRSRTSSRSLPAPQTASALVTTARRDS